jgi:hypothetical protein
VTRVEGPLQAGSMDPDRVADPTRRGSLGRRSVDRLAARPVRELTRMLSGPIQQARRNSTRPSIPNPWLLSEDRRPPGGGSGSVPEGVGARHLGRSRPPMLLEPHQVKLGASSCHAGQRPGDAHQVKHFHKCETRVRQPSAVYVGEAVSQCGRWPRVRYCGWAAAGWRRPAWLRLAGVRGCQACTRVQGHVRVELRLASRAHTCNLVPPGSLAGVPARRQDRDAKPAV